MQKYKLKNGITLIFEKRPTKSIVVEILVKTGSNNEPKQINGISHFLEHMLFEGTKKRNTLEIANEIEKLGGEINAYTASERTAFYVKVLNKHFEKALDVLSDIIKNPLFEKKSIEKERKIILKEIDMVTDQPRFHQWILFTKTLFKKHPTKNPTYGTRKAVSRITRKQLINYYKKYYVPNNIIITIVGNVKNPKVIVEKYFSGLKPKRISKKIRIIEPKQKQIQKKTEKRKILSSYVVLGYKTPRRIEKESYVFEIIRAILGRGQSGKLFHEIRAKRGLAYEIGVHHESNTDYGFFAVYLNTDKKNLKLAIRLILEEFSKLKNTTKKELNEAKTFLEGEYFLSNEDNFHVADDTSFWEMVKDADLAKNYIKEIKKITKKDIVKVVDRFLDKNYTLAVIEQN